MTGNVTLTRVAGLGPFGRMCDALGDGALRRVLAAEGVPAGLIEKPEALIPLPAMFGLFERAARMGGEDLFGLRVGERMEPKDFGLWARYTVSGRNLAVMIQRAARSIEYHHPGASFRMESRGDLVIVILQSSRTAGRGRLHYMDHLIAPILRSFKSYAGRDWAPAWVELDYARPPHWRRLEEAIGVPVVFDATGLGIVFSPALLDLPPIKALPLKAAVTFTDLRRVVVSRPPQTVTGVIRKLLVFGSEAACWDLESVARLLHRSCRSIQRDLQIEGTSFRRVLAEARRAEAERLIRGTEAPLEDIAWHLGYSEHPHFTRAFTQWAGVSPSVYRERSVATNICASHSSHVLPQVQSLWPSDRR